MSLSFAILIEMSCSSKTLKRVLIKEVNSTLSTVSSPLISSKLKMSSTSSSVGISAPRRSVIIFMILGNSLLVNIPLRSLSNSLNIFSSIMAAYFSCSLFVIILFSLNIIIAIFHECSNFSNFETSLFEHKNQTTRTVGKAQDFQKSGCSHYLFFSTIQMRPQFSKAIQGLLFLQELDNFFQNLKEMRDGVQQITEEAQNVIKSVKSYKYMLPFKNSETLEKKYIPQEDSYLKQSTCLSQPILTYKKEILIRSPMVQNLQHSILDFFELLPQQQTENGKSLSQNKVFVMSESLEPQKIKIKESIDLQFYEKELDELYLIGPKMLSQLVNNSISLPFRLPVDPVEDGVPDYYSVIKTPMDLQTIRLRLQRGKYHSKKQFYSDLGLIISNSNRYHRNDLIFRQITSKFERLYKKLKRKFDTNNSKRTDSLLRKPLSQVRSQNDKELESRRDKLEQSKQTTKLQEPSEFFIKKSCRENIFEEKFDF